MLPQRLTTALDGVIIGVPERSTQSARCRMQLFPSRVAQVVEQVTVNHPVGGSSPSPGAER